MRRARASMIAVTRFRIPSAELEILRDITKQTRASKAGPPPQISRACLAQDKKKPAANELRASSLSRGRLKEQFNHLYDCKPQKKVRKDFSSQRANCLQGPGAWQDPSHLPQKPPFQPPKRKRRDSCPSRRMQCCSHCGRGCGACRLVGSCCEAFTFAYRCRQRRPGCSAWWPRNPKA